MDWGSETDPSHCRSQVQHWGEQTVQALPCVHRSVGCTPELCDVSLGVAGRGSVVADVLFDLATKIVTKDQQIWSIFPGIGRKFFGMFIEHGAVFLDTPGLRISSAVLQNDDLLRQHVAMSHAWIKYYYNPDRDLPSNRPDDYPIIKIPSFNAAVGNVRNVFIHMKPGDLVLVGGHSLYDPILIGEIAEPFDARKYARYERYGNDRIPIRSVNWLQTGVERRWLSQPLSTLLSNRKAVVRVDKTAFGEEIYRFAYGDYISGTESRYIYKGPKYKNIALAAVPGIDLISYFCAAFNAAELGELVQFAKQDIKKGTDDYFEQDVLYSFEIDFSSPGAYVLHAKRAVLPLLVAVLVSATSGTISLNDARSAEVTNSATASSTAAAAPNECVEIQEKYRAIMNSINADRFNQLCKLNKEARDGVGLKVGVKQKAKPKK
jgi:hypothetical protein